MEKINTQKYEDAGKGKQPRLPDADKAGDGENIAGPVAMVIPDIKGQRDGKNKKGPFDK